MLGHVCDAGMSIVVVHDVPGVVLFQVCGCWKLYVGRR